MNGFAVTKQIPLQDEHSDPVRIGNDTYTYGAEYIGTDYIIWRRGGVLCLISIPWDLTDTRRWLAENLIRSAADVAALQDVITFLNEAPC